MNTQVNFLKVGDKRHHFDEHDLPALINYKSKEGGSHYSMGLIENLALQGSKALILTGYPEAKEQFMKEAAAIADKTIVVHNMTELKKNKDKQVIIIHDDDEKLCLEAIKTLDDINDRIIFIKNINIFHKQLLSSCLKYNKLILSGELDVCSAKANLSKKKYNAVILFSQPKIKLPYTFVPLEKYAGYIRSKNKESYVKSVV